MLVFKLLLSTGIAPDELKIAKVVAICKKKMTLSYQKTCICTTLFVNIMAFEATVQPLWPSKILLMI